MSQRHKSKIHLNRRYEGQRWKLSHRALGQTFHCSIFTSNDQRLGSAFDDLDPRLSVLCYVGDDVIHPCKICGGCQCKYVVPRSIHSINQRCPTQSRLQSVVRVRSFSVERKKLFVWAFRKFSRMHKVIEVDMM